MVCSLGKIVFTAHLGIGICVRYLHLTSILASTTTDFAAYDSCIAKHFNISPCLSRVVGICTTDAADHVRGLSGSVAFVCG